MVYLLTPISQNLETILHEYWPKSPPRTPEDFYDSTLRKNERHSAVFLPVFYSLLFVFGVTSNGLVMWVILMSVKLLSIVDIYLLLLITLPFLAHYSRADWVFGSGMCKVVMGSYYIGFNSSIFFVVIMSIDRYLAVVHAVNSLKTISRKYRLIMITVTWIIGLLASFPEITLIDVHQQHHTSLCEVGYHSEPFWRAFGLFKMNVTSLLIPFFIMVFCYSMILRRILLCKSTNRRTIRLVLLVVLVFFCCWTPYNVASFFQALELLEIYTSCKSSKAIQLTLQVTEALAYSHTCLNPIIYVFVGEKFRRHLFKLLNRIQRNAWITCTTNVSHLCFLNFKTRSSTYIFICARSWDV
uniref:G-protein coupled receptors family 1 profile domain-containing protein n=1 Tax=Paramormyrops kingsleyae TaxID=1676925 RepID=A0A3B3QXL8_9TELE